ncbi:MAG: hypothetical protein IT178_05515 [Acidobacteria bacterium]|nr:hypothetical protein [Acidobacteriota bacterium]
MARFSADAFEAAGVAYDSVSHRFLFGDRFGRKVRVLGEGLDRGVDLVRAESAGFLDVRGLDIDRRRGDLWVVSASTSGNAVVLHRLQLVSGRPLASIAVPADLLPLRPVDLVVTDAGVVLLLADDGAVLRLRPGQTEVKRVVAPAFTDARGLTTNRAGDVAYVAHAGGLGRVDLSTARVTAIAPPADQSIEGILRLRQQGGALLAVQAMADGGSRLVRLTLAPNGRRVRTMTSFDPPLAAAPALLIVGDAAVLVSGAGCADAPGVLAPCARSLTPSAHGSPAEIIVRRFTVQ